MSLAALLEAGESVFSAWSSIPDSQTVELVAGLDFGAVTLDMQHGGHHEDSVLRGIGGIRLNRKHPMVRIPVGRFDMASRALDMGAEAVIAPMVNSVQDARAFAAAMKYPPTGLRSWGPSFAMPRSGKSDGQAWLETANAETIAFAMIETRQALSALDDVLAVDGIDGVLVGPSDFSIAWSNGRTVDPALEDMMPAIETIAQKTRAAGKHAAIYVVDPGLVGRFHEMGFRLFALGAEAAYMQEGAPAMLKAARDSIKF
ncbi:HpcH/HpaI aldolase/citrate lyase family protein [Nitratireductor kimnyeongensis]|uniref:HpcH/HpaI aldolase/citrate lyase family protein n=1 Tax=Nitratireductor kimnyeongensis TaxID=430679 RepID=A0ABW0T2R7_9HYPH|nr:aldolase/citrate lyase family protein [Nitratireductor kimnyeongensis]QZZ37488.1 2,4-dihydroxyhept-2-ene-1,7-dioic acid aldolase [Nitratireductor kimnyeongensis]